MAKTAKKMLRTASFQRQSAAQLKQRFGPQTVPSNEDFADLIDLANAGPRLFEPGMIMMFSGAEAPVGWVICDGENGAPDLRSRFIVGCAPGQHLSSAVVPLEPGIVITQTETLRTNPEISLALRALTLEHMPAHQHEAGLVLPKQKGIVLTGLGLTFEEEDRVNVAPGMQLGHSELSVLIKNSTGPGDPALVPYTGQADGDPHGHDIHHQETAHGHGVSIELPYYALVFIMKLPYEEE